MTKYTKKILEIIEVSKDHPTVEDIFVKLRETYPDVVLATVYNNVNRLVQDKKIRRITLEGMSDRYDNFQRHDHCICKRCGKITDLHFKNLTSLIQKICDDPVIGYDLQVYTICEECRKKEN